MKFIRMSYRKLNHQCSAIALASYSMSLVIVLATVAITGNAQPGADGTIYWLTNVPSYTDATNSGLARLDGRMYCTDGVLPLGLQRLCL